MSLYLSQLILNPRSRNVRADLADCHGMHRTLLRAFPRATDADTQHGARERFGVLYRVETDGRSGVTRVLVQSRVEPDWDEVTEVDGAYFVALPDGSPNPAAKEISDALAGLRAGMSLVFRLRANPTRRVSSASADDPLRGKRVELQTEEQWQAWLARKGELGGFRVVTARGQAELAERGAGARAAFGSEAWGSSRTAVPDARAIQNLKLNGVKGTRDSPRKLTFGSVLFDGRLVITDLDAFRLSLEQGIGSGKAYGFGLLSIAPD
jgi:CRISPR system Cascade subunit CasE